MTEKRARLLFAFIAYAGWIVITLGGAAILHPEYHGLLQSISAGPAPQFIAAIAFLAVASWCAGWRDLALQLPFHSRDWLLLWLPSLFLLLFFGLAFSIGHPPASLLFWAGFNTLMVGISEELMFRGVLFRALAQMLKLRSAVAITTVLFGAVHSLNVLVTGDLMLALLQSVTACMSGLLFMALVVRTGSLLPAMLYHWLWDFGTFALVSASQTVSVQGTAAPSAWVYAIPTMVVLPNFLCALHLLRRRPEPAGRLMS